MVSSTYRRRRPEETVLYRTVRDHLSTFLEVASRRSGMKSLPTYVRQEFDRYLDCGVLANGFARVRCPGCGHDEAVAFSCTRLRCGLRPQLRRGPAVAPVLRTGA